MPRRKNGNGWCKRKRKPNADINNTDVPAKKRREIVLPTEADETAPTTEQERVSGTDAARADEVAEDPESEQDERMSSSGAAGAEDEASKDAEPSSSPEHEMVQDVNFVEGLEELQRLHGNEKHVHFFEYVMAMVLGARLDKATTIEQFVRFIAGPSMYAPKTHFNLSLQLCGRKFDAVILHQKKKRDNVINLYYVRDGKQQFNVFQKRGTSDAEIQFLHWARNRVRYGDLNAVPLILDDINPGQTATHGSQRNEFSFFTPDYGNTLQQFLDLSDFVDMRILSLTLLSTLCSVSCANNDSHEKNVCVYHPEIVFRYKWTVRMACHLIEICWDSKGALATIDWEKNELFPRTSSFISSGNSSSISPLIWKAKIGNFEKYGLTLQGEFAGTLGMATILNHVLTHFDASLFKVKYREMPEYGSNTSVSSLLELSPLEDEKACCFEAKTKAVWNQAMSSRGKVFKKQKYICKEDIQYIRNLYNSFTKSLRDKPFYDIPSDLGNVVLMKNGKLEAIKPLLVGEVITYVPITKCETFSNPRVWVGSISGNILKKPWPFCGFGGFVQWGSEESSNCMMKTIGSFIALFATKSIRVKDTIICKKTWFERYETGDLEDFARIKAIVKRLYQVSAQTRSDALHEASTAAEEQQEEE